MTDNSDMSTLVEKGLATRRQLFGDAYVDSAFAGADDFDRPIQELMTAFGYGGVWARPGLPMTVRSMITIALIASANRPVELKQHVKGALRNGVTPDQIREVMLHVALYCGGPAGMGAFRTAQEALREAATTA
jgi:4-carboxymuconolactone decarboxylase